MGQGRAEVRLPRSPQGHRQYVTKIWFNDKYVYGGRKAIATTSFGDAPKPMFENPPKCWLHRQGNFITTFFPEGLEAGRGLRLLLPASASIPPYGKPVLGAGDIYAMFNDRPEVRAVIQYFSTGEFGQGLGRGRRRNLAAQGRQPGLVRRSRHPQGG